MREPRTMNTMQLLVGAEALAAATLLGGAAHAWRNPTREQRDAPESVRDRSCPREHQGQTKVGSRVPSATAI